MSNKSRFNIKDIVSSLKKGETSRSIANRYNYSLSNFYVFCRKNNIQLPKLDLVGTKWKYFTVIEKMPPDGSEVPSHRKNKRWKCLCECGNIRIFSTKVINRQEYQSCGKCYKSSREHSKLFKGYGEIHSKFWNRIICGAKKRKHIVEIDIQYAWDLFLKQDRRCALSGVKLYFPNTIRDFENGHCIASLDRIDASVGYIRGNLQWVSKNINLAKQKLNNYDFIKLCELVTNHNSSSCRMERSIGGGI